MTEPITFEDARKIARAYLSLADHMVVTGHPSGEALWDGPVTSAGPVRSELAMVALLKPDLLPSLLPEYIKLAHQDREWWDALCVFAGCLLRNNVPLADGLRLFIADVLTDNIEPPKRKTGPSKSVLYHRNLLIWEAINELVSRGMTATRNDASVGAFGLRCGRKGIGTDLQRGLERLAENETGRKRNDCPVEKGEMNIGAVTNITAGIISSTMRRAVTTLPEGSTYDPRVLPNAPKNPALEPIRSNIKAFKSRYVIAMRLRFRRAVPPPLVNPVQSFGGSSAMSRTGS